MTHHHSPLDQGVILIPRVTAYTGLVKSRHDEIEIHTKDVPESQVNAGSIRVYPSNRLAFLPTTRKKLERLFLERGTRFAGGFFHAYAVLQEVIAKADDICRNAKADIGELGQHFTGWQTEWMEDNGWTDAQRRAIQRLTPDRDHVLGQCRVGYDLFEVSIPQQAAGSDFANAHAQAEGLAESLYKEVAAKAEDMLAKTFRKDGQQADQVGQKAMRGFRYIVTKLNSLSFIDSSVTPLTHHIQALINAVPKTGAIEGKALMDLVTMLATLSVPDKAKLVGGGVARQSAPTGRPNQAPAVPPVHVPASPQPADLRPHGGGGLF